MFESTYNSLRNVSFVVNSVVVVTTNKTYYQPFHQSLLEASDVKFWVQGDSETHVALLTVPGNTRVLSYELIIGAYENQKTVLRAMNSKTGVIVTEVNSPNILDGSMPKYVSNCTSGGQVVLIPF